MRTGLSQSVMICNHVFDGAPILKAVRDAPLDEVDSGWQFHCNAMDHANEMSAKFIAVEELLEMEPSLEEYIDLPVGTVLERTDVALRWKKGKQTP